MVTWIYRDINFMSVFERLGMSLKDFHANQGPIALGW